ncbi:MAG: glycosyltransferase family 2 protein [Methanosphaera sp.]|nr:glycosyltransferase family 2 protein [Methanosphaera sp.]
MKGIIIKSKLSIVLLNWNGHEDTVECLDSLKNLNYTDFNIYLVDNNSESESVEYIKDYLKNQDYYSYETITSRQLNDYGGNVNLLFILNNVNAGFAGGNNVALDYLIKNDVCDYVLLLNNDTIVSSDFIDGLFDKYNEDDNTAFVGATHYYYDQRRSVQTVGGGIIDWDHGECMAIRQKDQYDSYDYITGSCIFMPIDILREVGPISTEYFMYWEDVDWSTVARKKGYDLKVSDYGCIYHKEGSSIKSLSRIYYHTANRILFMKKFCDEKMYDKFRIYIILYVLKEAFANFIKDSEYSKTLIRGLITGLKA